MQKTVIEQERKMALTYPMEKDIRFQQGVEKGLEKGLEKRTLEIAAEMLRRGADTMFICEVTQLTEAQVAELAKKIRRRKK